MALEQPPGVLNVESIDSSVQRHTTAALAGNRQGVCGATDFAVAQSSTPGMSVSVAAGYALVKGSTTTYQGMYSAHNDASIDDVAISPGDSSNPRYDIVGLLIEDADFSGADRQVSVHVVEGTPAGSPSDPPLPDSFLPLARVVVDANESTSILNADITDLREFAGDYRFEAAFPDGVLTWSSPVNTGITLGSGVQAANYVRTGRLIHASYRLVLGGSSAITGGLAFNLPVNALMVDGVKVSGQFVDAGTATYLPILASSTASLVVIGVAAANSTYAQMAAVSSTVPFTWASGDEINLSFEYISI